jgi:carboxymethylenebutenolidase
MTAEEIVRVWEAHTRAEFELKDVDAIMATVTDDVTNYNVPVGVGARGYDAVRAYYRDIFIASLPDDWQVEGMNRVVGEDQLVDEVHITFTHTKQMDWLVPGVPPTGRRVVTDMVAIVGFRDGKVSGERIYWDQLSVLRQVGVLPEG